MEKSLKKTDFPKPWFGSKSKAHPAPKNSRVTLEVMPEHQELEAAATGTCMKKGKGRGKSKKKKTVPQREKII